MTCPREQGLRAYEMQAHGAERCGGAGATLSRAEVVDAIQALADGEKTALAKMARLYATKTPYDHADLLQEAMCRVLSGERKWPKGISPLLFLGGVIRSVAWQWRRKDLALGETDGSGGPSTDPPQEWALFLDEFIGSFGDDPVAQAVLVAVMVGSKGQELLAVIEPILNSDANVQARGGQRAQAERELERVLKKIRRRTEKHRRETGPI